MWESATSPPGDDGTGDVVFAEDGVTSVADGHFPSGQDVGLSP